MQPQLTFGIVPLQTGTSTFNANNKTAPPRPDTAPPPITTFGQQPTFQPAFVPLQTGVITMPQTTFGGQSQQLPTQITGGAPPQTSFNQPALVPTQEQAVKLLVDLYHNPILVSKLLVDLWTPIRCLWTTNH